MCGTMSNIVEYILTRSVKQQEMKEDERGQRSEEDMGRRFWRCGGTKDAMRSLITVSTLVNA